MKYTKEFKQNVIEYRNKYGFKEALVHYNLRGPVLCRWIKHGITPRYKTVSAEHKQAVIKKCQKASQSIRGKKIKDYYIKNKERISSYNKNRYKDNKEKWSHGKKEYYIKNKNKIMKQHSIYLSNKYRNDPLLNITMRCRARMYRMLKDGGGYKKFKTFDLIGCTPQQLKDHLELKFINGMTWDNRNKWHIDHIKPCVSFDLSKKEEQMKCFNYSNLQPLWAEDNLKKHTKEVNNNGVI